MGHRARCARGADPAAGATPIDYQREDFTRVLPGGFDVVFDGIGEEGYRRSFTAGKRGGLRWLPGGKRARFYSINVMRARHPALFREDLERLFGLLATRAIQPRVAERISFDEVADAHRRLEAGSLEGKLVLCPDLPSRRDRMPPQREPGPDSQLIFEKRAAFGLADERPRSRCPR